jgi:hypothetical protein
MMEHPTILSSNGCDCSIRKPHEPGITIEADEHTQQYDDETDKHDRIRWVCPYHKSGIGFGVGEGDLQIVVVNRLSWFDDVGTYRFSILI